jgi:Flp pilus assembly protein TadG
LAIELKAKLQKLARDARGSVLVESTIIIPLFFVLVLGTIDVAFMLYEWGAASKAVYAGARYAIVSSPVPSNVIYPTYTTAQLQNAGQTCYNTSGTNVNCPSIPLNAPIGFITCTSTGSTSVSCAPNTYGSGDNVAFTNIVQKMQRLFPRIDRSNVTITYQTNGTGFVGEPAGLPMNVTVSLTCMSHQFFFIDALMNWAFTPPAGCPSTLQGPPMPSFSTTMQSEEMCWAGSPPAPC